MIQKIIYGWYWLCDAWDYFLENIFLPLLMIVLALCLMAAVYGAYLSAQSPTFALKKDEWYCIATVEDITIYPILIGKAVAAVPSSETECVRWEKRQ